jgi:hypothetical protein
MRSIITKAYERHTVSNSERTIVIGAKMVLRSFTQAAEQQVDAEEEPIEAGG